MSNYTRRYEGIRWRILYGSYDGVERYAVNLLQSYVQRFMPYVVAVEPAAEQDGDDHLILIGTMANNGLIRALVDRQIIPAPDGPEGYTVARVPSLLHEDRHVIAVAGSDPNGVLYGVQDLHARVLCSLPDMDPTDLRRSFDQMQEFSICERPLIANRGIWTWGYVIYDYKRFIDNMARCKMNMLTIWNDCPPLNARDIIEYAHSRGVQIILGFHWGWGIESFDPSNPEQRTALKAEILRNYTENYRGLGMDGIYFQTFTEVNYTQIGGRSVASLACEWVNDVSRALLETEPDLLIQFGLHATSIQDWYQDLKDLDPRVTITWEDAGSIPWSYDPNTTYNYSGVFAASEDENALEKTIAYTRNLATFRKDGGFAMVPKGFTCLRWHSEFEHHGPFILGERDPEFIRQRLAGKQQRWDNVNALWAKNYPMALRFYRELLDCQPGPVTATALIEDGVFEEKIQHSAALLAETLWDLNRDDAEIMARALSPHYR